MHEKCSTIRIDYTLDYGDLVGSLDPQVDLDVIQDLMEVSSGYWIAESFIKFAENAFKGTLTSQKVGLALNALQKLSLVMWWKLPSQTVIVFVRVDQFNM